MDVHEGELIQIVDYIQFYSITLDCGKTWSVLMDMGINRQSVLVTLVWFQWAGAYILAINPMIYIICNIKMVILCLHKYSMIIIIYALRMTLLEKNTALSFNRCILRICLYICR